MLERDREKIMRIRRTPVAKKNGIWYQMLWDFIPDDKWSLCYKCSLREGFLCVNMGCRVGHALIGNTYHPVFAYYKEIGKR